MLKHKFFKVALILLVLFASHITKADVIITEIMYDPDGTDTGREWIEVQNTSETPIDLFGYKILESGTNHRVSLSTGANATLSQNEYAVVADNVDKFLIDFPNFAGKLFDSVFSLVNTGEELKVISSAGAETNAVTYDPQVGGQNTGNSLQLNDGLWIPALPTPASINATIAEDESVETDTGTETGTDATSTGGNTTTNQNSTHSSTVSLTSYKPKTILSINSGRDRIATINTPIEFVATHNQTEEDFKPRFKWSMGDGSMKTATKFKYTFQEEGAYNIVLNAHNTDYSAVSRSKILVFRPNVDILLKSSGELVDIMLKNLSVKEVNFGGFFLEFGKNRFTFPNDTILSPQNTITLKSNITKFKSLTPTENPAIKLYYPNGILLTELKNENLIENTQ